MAYASKNGSSVCGGLEPSLGDNNVRGWTPKISHCPVRRPIVTQAPAVVESKLRSTERNLGNVAPMTQRPTASKTRLGMVTNRDDKPLP
jgi:hypothetical protein